MSTKRPAHYVLSSHWDREWYRTFQHFRYHLVEMLDIVLDALKEKRLHGAFVTDGQAIVIEDYLEVRPERRVDVEALARTGRLIIGPWYNLPDEFCVSGESLIRNLSMGNALVEALGAAPSNAGFLCDLFGHNSQMPQILAGFGIPVGFLWRGINTYQTRHLIWQGADGTRLPCYRFGTNGYWGYAVNVRHNVIPDYEPERARFQQDLQAYLASEAAHTEIDPVLLFDGGDHHYWDEAAYNMLWQCELPGYEITHTSLDDYMKQMLEQVKRIQTEAQGELWEPAKYPLSIDQQYLIGGTLAGRVWIKQENRHSEVLLCHWAEPFSAFAAQQFSQPHPTHFLHLAWKWLLQNHPHDSICGCSLDRVHEDMRYRFHQSQDISEKLTHEAIHHIAGSIVGDLNDSQLRVAVFNPLPRPLKQVCQLTLLIPASWRMINPGSDTRPNFEPNFRIYDARGQEMPYQLLSLRLNQRDQYHFFKTKAPQDWLTHRVTVSLMLDVPAMGYASFLVQEGDPQQPHRYPLTPRLATSERSMENPFLKVTVEANGSLTLTDKRTGQTYSHLMVFEDSADIGSGYGYLSPASNRVYTSTAARADVSLIHDGRLQATFRIHTVMSIPRRFDSTQSERDSQHIDMPIDTDVTLRTDADWLEMTTTIRNAADDHRVRVLFPTGAEAQTYLCDTPFDVVQRPIALRPDNHHYREPEQETKPQQSWTAVHDQQRGLAVIADGLLETAARDLPERPIALTLFRATAYVIRAEAQTGGQLHGNMTFRYWLLPFAGAPDRTRLCELGQFITSGIRAAQIRPPDFNIYRQSAALPPTASFLTLEGDAVLTSTRQVDHALEVRLFNPNATPATIRLQLNLPFVNVQQVNLKSERLTPTQTTENGSYTCTLNPKQIITLCFTE